MRSNILYSIVCLSLLSLLASSCTRQPAGAIEGRVKTNLSVPYEAIGVLTPKSIAETNNDLTLGCEVLDRDYADYHQYKEYLAPLGLKKIRLQAGWAKTEKVKGVYDFEWLDAIINDATERGLKIWLQTSYGNPIYKGGGTPYLKGGWPTSTEGKAAWDKWVRALAERYKGKVHEWEIWNEPDINKEQIEDYKSFTEMTSRTAEIIKAIDPDAKIAILALAYADANFLEKCLKDFQERDKLHLFDWVTYHQYMFRPEDVYRKVDPMRGVLQKYAPHIKLWQGENGAPSRAFGGGALGAFHWSEVSQAKWALRRMLGDHGQDIATGIFCIADMNYGGNDAIKKKNVKGLLETDDQNKVVRVKKAYYAVQNMAAVFDMFQNRIDAGLFDVKMDYHLSLYPYQDTESGLHSFLVWYDETIPSNFNQPTPADIEISNGNFKNPVWVDLLTGVVYKIPTKDIKQEGDTYHFNQVPIYDSPVLITDESLIQYE